MYVCSSGRSCITLDTTQVIYNASCDSSLNAFLEANLAIVGGVGIAFGIFEVRYARWVESLDGGVLGWV